MNRLLFSFCKGTLYRYVYIYYFIYIIFSFIQWRIILHKAHIHTALQHVPLRCYGILHSIAVIVAYLPYIYIYAFYEWPSIQQIGSALNRYTRHVQAHYSLHLYMSVCCVGGFGIFRGRIVKKRQSRVSGLYGLCWCWCLQKRSPKCHWKCNGSEL